MPGAERVQHMNSDSHRKHLAETARFDDSFASHMIRDFFLVLVAVVVIELSIRYALERKGFSLDVDLQVPLRGITGLLGESGSGKTTLLRCIAGLETPALGRLIVDGDIWQDTTRNVSRKIHQREIGYVFQEPRLFRHLSVRGNLEYGQRRRRASHRLGRTEAHRWPA